LSTVAKHVREQITERERSEGKKTERHRERVGGTGCWRRRWEEEKAACIA
jgi:hypothetical protein